MIGLTREQPGLAGPTGATPAGAAHADAAARSASRMDSPLLHESPARTSVAVHRTPCSRPLQRRAEALEVDRA